MSAPPRLVIELELEAKPRVRVLSESAEDEARLVAWVWRSRELRQLGLLVLAALDARERKAA